MSDLEIRLHIKIETLEKQLAEAREQLTETEKCFAEQNKHLTIEIEAYEQIKKQRDRLVEALGHTVKRLEDFEGYLSGDRKTIPLTSGAIAFAKEALKGASHE